MRYHRYRNMYRAGTYFIPVRKTVLFMLRHLPLLIGHFVCWFTLFALPMLFDTTDFVRSLPKTVISAAIFTLILSYREARSHLKGMAIERGIWTKWYYRRIKTIAQEGSFEEPPSPENVKAYAYFGEIPETLFFMIRNLKPFIVHLTCWVSAYAFLCFITLRPEDTPEDIFEVFEIIAMFGQFLPWIAIIVFLISYREARGNLKGIADRQQVWMQWYQEQQETIKQGDTFEGTVSIGKRTSEFLLQENAKDPAIHGTPSDVSYGSFRLLVSRLYFQIRRFSLFYADPFCDYTCSHLQLSRSKRENKRCCKRRRGMDEMVSTAKRVRKRKITRSPRCHPP